MNRDIGFIVPVRPQPFFPAKGRTGIAKESKPDSAVIVK
jgi:hypothetical protein